MSSTLTIQNNLMRDDNHCERMEAIIQWNINGVKKHNPELKLLIANSNPVCIAMQETHLIPGEPFEVRGYKFFRKDSIPIHRAAKGVALAIREEILCTQLPLLTHLHAIAVQIKTPQQLTICSVYLPDRHWTLTDIRSIFSQLTPPFLVLGDFNSHSPLWGSTRRDAGGFRLEQLLDDENIILLNTGAATYLNSRSNEFSCIDLSFASPSVASRMQWMVMDDMGDSDHFPIAITSAIERQMRPPSQKWITKRADWKTFQNSIIAPLNMLQQSAEQATSSLTDCILSAAMKSIPLSRAINYKKIVPWWCPEVARAISQKKRLFNRYKRQRTVENLVEFKKARAIARRTILECKRDSWKKYVETIGPETSSREIWKKVRAVDGHRRNTFITCLRRIHENDELETSPEQIVEILADSLERTSNSLNYDQHFRDVKNLLEVPIDFSQDLNADYNKDFSLQELEYALTSTKETAPGPDGISYEIIKNVPEPMKTSILELFNKIWACGNYPTQWREALVIPVLKEGKPSEDPTSYRPISLTCCLGKLMEKMVSERLIWYLEKRKLLVNYQAGFRKNRSTTDNLTMLKDEIERAFRKREHLVAVFFDLEKAYDLTWRYNILDKMHQWGFRGRLPRYIVSFLSDRSFRVKMGSVISQRHTLENGIPQGSTLSVILFAIAVNDIACGIDNTIGKSLYVDDLAIYASGDKIGKLNNVLQTAIDTIVQNADKTGFKLSLTKTSCMHFCRLRKPHYDPLLYVKGKNVKCVDSFKFLGLHFDAKLNWRYHVDNLIMSCKRKLNLLKVIAGIKWGGDANTLLGIYQTLILSRIDYGCEVYGTASQSLLKKLDTVHHAALRYCLGAFRTTPSLSLCAESGLMPLKQRRLDKLASYVIRVEAMPDNPVYSLWYGAQERISSSGQQIRNRLELSNNAKEKILPNLSYEIPPWTFNKPQLDIGMSLLPKSETSKEIYHQKWQQKLRMLSEYKIIYTDGSKSEGGAGCAFVTGNVEQSWTLNKAMSVESAEAWAIIQALNYCESNQCKAFVVATDSLKLLKKITHLFSKNPLINIILNKIELLKNSNKNILFIWIPAHMEIGQNEKADALSKVAARGIVVDIEELTKSERKASLRTKIKMKWHNEWQMTHSWLSSFKQNVESWVPPLRLNRHDRIKIERLRLGHTRLTHSHLLTGEPQASCNECDLPLTVKHIICDCQMTQTERIRHGIKNNVSEMLNHPENIQNLLDFLRDIDLYKMI